MYLSGRRFHALSSLNSAKASSASTIDISDHNISNSNPPEVRDGPLKDYLQAIKSGELNIDARQNFIVSKLQNLHEELKNYTPSGKDQGSSWFRVRLTHFYLSNDLLFMILKLNPCKDLFKFAIFKLLF